MLLNSEKEVIVAGSSNILTCIVEPDDITRLTWYINGTEIDGTRTDVRIHVVPSFGEIIGILNMLSVSTHYDKMDVLCEAMFTSGTRKTSDPFTLHVQGIINPL